MSTTESKKVDYRFENAEAQKIYNALVQAGMKPADIDVGYCNIDYSRSGPNETCLTNKAGDGSARKTVSARFFC